jgi:hypothetical protein
MVVIDTFVPEAAIDPVGGHSWYRDHAGLRNRGSRSWLADLSLIRLAGALARAP